MGISARLHSVRVDSQVILDATTTTQTKENLVVTSKSSARTRGGHQGRIGWARELPPPTSHINTATPTSLTGGEQTSRLLECERGQTQPAAPNSEALHMIHDSAVCIAFKERRGYHDRRQVDFVISNATD